MKQKEKLINHGLMRLLLFALVMLVPIGTWAQTGCGLFIGDYEGYEAPTPVGVSVNTTNASNITHDCIKSGTVSFDYESRTLTLNNATIDGSIYSGGALTLNLIGDNYITAADSSAFVGEVASADQDLTIKGTGSLLAKGTTALVSSGFNAPTFQDGQSLLLWEGYDENFIFTALYGTQLFSGGTGTSNVPYKISTVDDLNKLSTYVNEGLLSDKYYELQNDIDCLNNTGFVPIGNSVSYPFSGTFNGNNKKIVGLSYTTTNTADYVGLFARVGDEQFKKEGNIQNLELKDCTFGGGMYAGAIAGRFLNGSLQNCKVSGNTTISAVGDGAEAGALIGNFYTGIFNGNYYYYSVTTSTKGPNDQEAVEKRGYVTRGLGNVVDKESDYYDLLTDDAAVLYTKQLTIPDLTQTFSIEGNILDCYEPKSDFDKKIFAFAPGVTSELWIYPMNDGDIPSSVVLKYTPAGGTEQKETLPNIATEAGEYKYSTEMPDADATLEVTLSQSYSLFIGDTQVTSANADDVLGDGGTVKFTSSGGVTATPVYTLTLNNAAITAPVMVGLPNLTIDIQGTNTITTAESCLQKMDNTDPAVTFKSTSTPVGSLKLERIDGEGNANLINNLSFSNELTFILKRAGYYYSTYDYLVDFYTTEINIVPSYGVKIGDTQVYSGNATDVFGDGTVSFDKESHTLTLNNASIGAVSTFLPTLNIELVGNNMITEGSFSTLQSLNGDDVTITVQSSDATKGCLVLKMGASSTEVFAGEHVTLNITSPLEVVSGDLTVNDGNLNVVTIGVPVDYELLVEDVRVVAANASNITNGASFDAATNTLTLDNSNFNYYWLGDKVPIQSDIQKLTIKLVGDNEVTLGSKVVKYIGKAPNATPKLTFVSEVEDSKYGSLTIKESTSTDAIAEGYQITNNVTDNQSASGLIYTLGNNSIKLWSQETYGIVVTKGDVSCLINNANQTNVLGDANVTAPSVVFDGYNRLVLNNAELTSIVVNAANSLPAKGLDIYLEGNSKITNTAGYAISYEGAAAVRGLSFHTGSDAPGTLVCTNSSAITFTPFEGFYESYFNNLAGFVENNKVTVKMPLGLIVDASTTVSTLVYDSNPAGRDDEPLDNVAFDNVLYTLHDDGTQAAADGFDQERSLVVVNSLMTDEQVKAIDTKQYIPGSNEYKARFTGLTFVVPAGTGTIKLKLRTNSPGSYAFHVMVDYQDPIEIIPTATLSEYVVDYACSDVSYVKVYLVALDAPAPNLHRAGPKATISGGIGGMTVSSSLVSTSPNAGLQYRLLAAGDFMQRGNHIDIDATDVTDLADNAFGFAGSPAPAMGSNRVAPSGHITYIDASKTSITGKNYSRTEGAFVGVPEETLIFLPAGNTAVGKNFIIGGICDDMAPLNAASENEYEVATDFIAAKAEYNREFTQSTSNGECFSVFLPYALDIYATVGEFFTYGGFDGTEVKLNKVTGSKTEANTPYIFKPAQTGALKAMYGAAVKKLPDTYVEAAPGADVEDEGLHGVYKYHKWDTKPSNIYCYSASDKGGIKAGEFAKVGEGTHIKPFRAYLRINGISAPESLSINWGDGTTSIIPIDKSQVQQDADGWYTITGFRLPSKPTEKGLYINGSKKIVVK